MDTLAEIETARAVLAFKLPQLRDLVARQVGDDYDNPVIRDEVIDRWQALGVDVSEYRALRDEYLAHYAAWSARR